MIATGGVDWSSILDSSKLSTKDGVTVFGGESSSVTKSGLRPLAIIVDWIEDWSVSERVDLCFSPLVVTTEALTPTLFRVFM